MLVDFRIIHELDSFCIRTQTQSCNYSHRIKEVDHYRISRDGLYYE